jgi:hypothetical protein
MVATISLLDFDVDEVLVKVEKLTCVKFPRGVIGVSLEPELKVLCIRFKKPVEVELAEPIRPGIHLFTDRDTEEITSLEITDLEKLKLAS